MSLKINPKILKAIEESDEKNLPAKTFLRGFIRSYAQYLRLDVEEILKQFQDELGSTRPAEPKNETTPTTAAPIAEAPKGNPSNQSPIEQKIIKPKKEKPLGKAKDENLNPSSSSRVFTIIGAIVLVLLIAFVAKMVEKYQKESVRHETQDVTTTTLPMGPSENLAAPNGADGGVVDGAPVVGISTPPKPTEMMTSAPIKATTTSTTVRPTTTTIIKDTATTEKIIAVVPKTTTTTTTSTSTTKVPKTTTTSTTLKPTVTTTTLAAKK